MDSSNNIFKFLISCKSALKFLLFLILVLFIILNERKIDYYSFIKKLDIFHNLFLKDKKTREIIYDNGNIKSTVYIIEEDLLNNTFNKKIHTFLIILIFHLIIFKL